MIRGVGGLCFSRPNYAIILSIILIVIRSSKAKIKKTKKWFASVDFRSKREMSQWFEE